ncbi:MAG: DUF4197 domain-containing protein [Bacteroidales bacterium]|nr:DUF4197 domain-containing protein [Bacteroidales bacterium]
MRHLIITLMAGMTFCLTSCTELLQMAQTGGAGLAGTGTITEADNISGLKSALNVGIEQAVKRLGTQNGFYGDQLLKIMLPEEAQVIVRNLQYIPNGDQLVEKAVLALNRAAEDAVTEAVPIFKNAIRKMTINDAAQILFGADNAATTFLRRTTYDELTAAFAPKVAASLKKPLVSNVSTIETWNTLTSAYNTVAKSLVGQIANLTPVDVSLENYVTGKALDALFNKIADEEKAIRTDPKARVSTLLQRVFGQLDKK